MTASRPPIRISFHPAEVAEQIVSHAAFIADRDAREAAMCVGGQYRAERATRLARERGRWSEGRA